MFFNKFPYFQKKEFRQTLEIKDLTTHVKPESVSIVNPKPLPNEIKDFNSIKEVKEPNTNTTIPSLQ